MAAPDAPRRSLALLALPAAAAVVVGVVAFVDRAPDSRLVDTSASPSTAPPAAPLACGDVLPFAITVPGAAAAPSPGPAPGRQPAADGQLVQHWLAPEGAVEARWPAARPAVYGDGTTPATMLASGITSTRDRVEIDVAPDPKGPVPSGRPDVVVERGPGATMDPPCDLVELVVLTEAGQWRSGLRATAAGSQAVFDPVDLQPRVAERRAVDVAPTTAITCRGSDATGTPENRFGGPHPQVRGTQPVDALLAFLAAMPGFPQSGYVEMTASDGSITYGANPSGDGWTTLVTVARTDQGWQLQRWTASGC